MSKKKFYIMNTMSFAFGAYCGAVYFFSRQIMAQAKREEEDKKFWEIVNQEDMSQ